MFELFLFGTFWFWALTVAVAITVLLCSENDNAVAGTVSFLVYVGLLQFLGDVNILGYIRYHPLLCIGWFAGYFGVGLCWAAVKWVLLCKDKLSVVEDHYRDFLEGSGRSRLQPWSSLSDEDKNLFDDYLDSRRLSRKPPRFRDNFNKFCNWIAFWLCNIIYTFLSDFVLRTARTLARSVSRQMQAVSDKIWKNFQ